MVYVAGVLIVGVSLMFLGTAGNEKEDASQPAYSESQPAEEAFKGEDKKEPGSISKYEELYENQLRESLEAITGVSDVTIMVNLDATENKVIEKNRTIRQQITDETDREGGKRKVEDGSSEEQVVIIRQGDQEEPLIVKTEKPEVRGVLVVAQGVENMKVKEWVVEAVTRVLDVPPHRVSVLPKKMKEEDE
nr:stage III sporulation protein AG [Bacillus sp. FJAT-44742]